MLSLSLGFLAKKCNMQASSKHCRLHPHAVPPLEEKHLPLSAAFSSDRIVSQYITVHHSISQYISQYRLPIADIWMTGRYVANSLRSLWCPRNCGTKLSDTSISARLRSIFHLCSHMLLMLLVLLMPGHSVLPPRRNPRGSCIKLSLD